MQQVKSVQIETVNYKDLLKSFERIVTTKVNEAIKDQPRNASPEFMSRKEVASLFDVTLPTVHNWINAGILKPYKIGAKTRFKRSEVLASPKAIKLNSNAI